MTANHKRIFSVLVKNLASSQSSKLVTFLSDPPEILKIGFGDLWEGQLKTSCLNLLVDFLH